MSQRGSGPLRAVVPPPKRQKLPGPSGPWSCGPALLAGQGQLGIQLGLADALEDAEVGLGQRTGLVGAQQQCALAAGWVVGQRAGCLGVWGFGMRPRLVPLGAQVLAGCPRVPLRPVRPIGAAAPGPVGAGGSIGSIGRCTGVPRWSRLTPLTELARRAGGAPAGA